MLSSAPPTLLLAAVWNHERKEKVIGSSYKDALFLDIELGDSVLINTDCNKSNEIKARRIPRLEEVLAEYFKDYPPQSSDWFAEQANLFNRYVIPRYGGQWLTGVGKHRWFEVIEKAALEQRSRGIKLHKSLKAFLNYAKRRKLLTVNPLGRTTLDSLSIRDASSINAELLGIGHLRAIYEGAQKLGAPWGPALGLAVLTGESVADACQVRGGDIDWEKHTWTVEWREGPGLTPSPIRILQLPAEALQVLAGHQDTKGYFFAERKNFGRPINFHAEVIDLLKRSSGVDGDWGTREIRRAVCREIKCLAEGPEAVSTWSKKFAEHLFKTRGASTHHNEMKSV